MWTVIAKRVALPLLGAVSRGYWRRLVSELRTVERSQWDSHERVAERQWRLLTRLLRHAYETSSYYRRLLRDMGAEPQDFRSMEDFSHIPALTRDALRRHQTELVSETWTDRVVPNATGGSSGQPVTFGMDPGETAWRAAAMIRHNRWAGWEVGQRCATLWGASRDLSVRQQIKERLANALLFPGPMLDAFALTEEDLARFAADVVRERPTLLFGYANALLEFARYVKQKGISGIAPEGIISSAEVLWPRWRAEIEATFAAPVYDRYGAREVGLVASQCECRGAMHINADHVLVEFDGDASSKRPARILVTKLRSRAMPMLRYDIGDMGFPVGGRCECGRGLPRMGLAGARATDFLVGADGRRVSGAALTLLTRDLPQLGQVQLRQERVGAVRVLVVPGPGLQPNHLGTLSAGLRSVLGSGTRVEIEQTNHIPREPSGKYRFAVCALPHPSTTRPASTGG